MKKRIIGIACMCILMLTMALTAFAATTSFKATLPAKQADTEVSTVRRATTYASWMINVTSIGSGTDAVCAWTETTDGYNLSSPYKQVKRGISTITYTSKPNIGVNVTLNLDNPVYSTSSVAVSGYWSPN